MELTPEMKKELAKLDIAVRARVEGDQFRQTAPEIEVVDLSNRILRFRTSDETVDAYGDIIRVKGWDLSNWEKNPVFLWHHNRGVGQGIAPLASGVSDKITAKALVQEFAFAPPEIYPFADVIFKMYVGVEDAKLGRVRFLNMTSVGFRGLGYEVPDEKTRKKLGMGPYGVIFTSMLLKEVSAVTVPANPNAGILKAWKAMAAQKALTSDDLDLLEERELLSDVLKDAWQEGRGHRMVKPTPPPDLLIPEGGDRRTIEEVGEQAGEMLRDAVDDALSSEPVRQALQRAARGEKQQTAKFGSDDCRFPKDNLHTLPPNDPEGESADPDPAESEASNRESGTPVAEMDDVLRELRELRAEVGEVKENLADLHEEVSTGLTVRAAYAPREQDTEDTPTTNEDWRDVFLDD